MKNKILFLVLLGFSFFLKGQNHISLYNFNHVNQSLMVNPSAPSPYRLVIGVPGLSRISTRVHNTFVEAGDIFNDNAGSDNIEAVIDNMSDKELLNLYENIDLIYAGFRIKSGFISFGVQQEATFNTVIPGDLFRLLYYGNQNQNGEIDFTSSNFNMEALVRINYHLGYQHYLLDSTLIAGARFKYISGTGHMHFKNFDLSMQSDIFEWNVNTNILMESSGGDYITNFSDYSPLELINPGNPGWGLDLGLTYILPKMSFSASVLNIGKIKWNTNNEIWQSQGSFTYSGIEVDAENQDFDFDEILDSLESKLKFTELTPYSYSTKLPMHIMANFEYKLTPKHAFAFTYQGTSWSGSLYNNFGVNYIGRWGKRFNLILGYSRLSGGLNSAGAGISMALGPMQMYLMSDNVWGTIKPTNLSAISFRLGMNVVLFNKTAKKEEPASEI